MTLADRTMRVTSCFRRTFRYRSASPLAEGFFRCRIVTERDVGDAPGRHPGSRAGPRTATGAGWPDGLAARHSLEKANGEENCRLHKAAGAGRRGESVAAHRSRARSARPQHHGVLQGVQRQDGADGEGDAHPRHHHRLSGPLLHLRDEAAAGLLLPQEGGWPQDRQEAGLGLQDARPQRRGQGDQGADP